MNAFTSAQDDHTLLLVPTSTFTAHPYTHDKLPYDPQRDLLPIATVTVIVIALASPDPSNRFARRLRRDGASPSGNAQRGGGSRQLGSRAGGIP